MLMHNAYISIIGWMHCNRIEITSTVGITMLCQRIAST